MSPKRRIAHINYALLAKAHPKRHLIHKFWARKPHNVVAEYIKHYTNKGDIVLDPFVGSGVTAIEASILGRKAVAIDIDPIATFITEKLAEPIDLDEFKKAFKQIEKEARDRINSLYLTKCPKCGKECLEVYVIWSDIIKCNTCGQETSFINIKKEKGKYIGSCGHSVDVKNVVSEEPIEIGYDCKSCRLKMKRNVRFLIKKGEELSEDIERLRKFEKLEIPFWVPRDIKLRYPTGKQYKEGTHQEKREDILSLFTRRKLVALSILWHEIERIEDEDIRDFMKFVFSSNLHNVSKLNPVHQPRWKRGQHPSTSWIVHRYWIPPLRVELPVWFYFKERFRHVLDAKKETNCKIPFLKKAKKFEDLRTQANFFVSTQSALDLSNIPNNSIDYVFTDPPYGGDIQYFELSTLWLAWLRGEHFDKRFNLEWWENEITINPQQGKDFTYYHNRLHVAFREIFRVLKPGRYLTVTFHNTEVKVYNSIIRAVIFAGFELGKIIYQPPARASAKARIQPYGSAVGDYYIRFHKPKGAFTKIFEREADETRAKRIILESVKKILIERGEPTPLTDILKGHTLIYNELRKHGYRFFGANPESIGKVLNDYKDKEFVFIKGEGWWFKEPSKYHLEVPLNERVEEMILDTLHRKVASFDEILQDIYLTFTNALTPSPNSVKEIAEEYARPEAGKWKLKPKVREREKEHSEMIVFLAELGKKCGFKIWVGQKEQSDLFRGRTLSELCDFEQLSLANISPEDIDRYVKQIDLLWIEDRRVAFAFEVEYTTAITDAFMRCSAIPESHQARRFIVIPEERERFMYRKLNSQLLKDRVEKESWKLIFFKDLQEFYNKNEKKQTLNPKQILEIATLPVEEREKQATIDSFSQLGS